MKRFREWLLESKKFEDAETGKPIEIDGVHYSDEPITKIKKRKFYFSDEDNWSSPWMGEKNRKIPVKVKLQNPKVYKNSEEDFEGTIGSTHNFREVKKAGHDGIIYTPKNPKRFQRQAVHFYPTKGVKLVK